MTERSFARPIFFVLAAAIALQGCEETVEPVDHLAQGKEYLSQNVPQFADVEFTAFLASHPDSSDAKFGLALSRVQGMFHILDWILSIAGQYGTWPSSAPRRVTPVPDENDFLTSLLLNTLGDLLRLNRDASDYLTAVALDSSFTFGVDKVPMTIRDRTVLDFGGTWDPDSARILLSFSQAGESIMYILLSQDLKADFFGIFAHAKPLILSGGLDPGNLTGGASLGIYLNVLAYALSDPEYASFLTPSLADADANGVADGTEFGPRSRHAMEAALSHFAKAIDQLKANSSSAGVCRVTRGSSSLFGKLECGATGGSLSVNLTSSFRSALDRGVSHFAGHSPGTLSLKNDIGPLIGLIAALFVQSKIIDLPSVANVARDPALVEAFVKAVPSDLGFDFYEFDETPHSIRAFFPIARTDLEARENNFLFEWECPNANTLGAPLGSTSAFPQGSLACPQDAELIDSDHFSDPVFAARGIPLIVTDGTASPFPYLPILDPSFGGLLYFEKNGQFEKSTLQGLNDAIAGLGPLLGSAF